MRNEMSGDGNVGRKHSLQKFSFIVKFFHTLEANAFSYKELQFSSSTRRMTRMEAVVPNGISLVVLLHLKYAQASR